MQSVADRTRALALAWGAPGLFTVALLDSSFLPLPGITDFLLIVLVTRQKEQVSLYVLAAIVGSVLGCLAMHALGKSGGEALVRKRFTGERVERAMASLQRYGVMSILIPSLLPPPAPFKIFILLAGVVGISRTRLATAIAIGRSVRYGALGFLAFRYGDRAAGYLAEHGAAVSLGLAGLLGIGFAAFLMLRRDRGRPRADARAGRG